MFIVHSYNAVVQISEQVEKYKKKVPKQTISMELEMLVAALLVKKFFRRISALFTEGESNWIKRGAGLTLILLTWKV